MRKFFGVLIGLGSVIILLIAFSQILRVDGPVAEMQMQSVEDKVDQDSVDQYNIAVRHGSLIDQCVHAGLVSAAYLQAKNETKYAAWKETEKAVCRRAGIPQ